MFNVYLNEEKKNARARAHTQAHARMHIMRYMNMKFIGILNSECLCVLRICFTVSQCDATDLLILNANFLLLLFGWNIFNK